MYPVLFNIGNLQVSTFGVFLAIGIFSGGFAVWRIARGYDFDSEKILDLSFLTIAAGFMAARLIYVLTNLSVFNSLNKIFFLNTYPGLSFWGGFTGGLLMLAWLTKKNKVGWLQIGDFAMVGFFLAAFFAEIGCLFGGCGVGAPTGLFFGVNQVGVIGKRLPVQFFEGLVFLLGFVGFWKSAVKFHIEGSLLSKGLILIGLTKLIAGFFKSPGQTLKILNLDLSVDLIAAIVITGAGLKFYYGVYKKTPVDDLKQFWKFFIDKKTRNQAVANVWRGWYNHWVNLGIRLGKAKKKFFKLLNIKPNPHDF